MRTPRRRPAAIWPALLLALGLVVLGVLSVRELLVIQGWVGGSPWLTPALTASATVTADPRALAIAVVALLLGLVLLLVALRPASRTHRRAPGDADVWTSPAALTHLAREAAERTRGVSAVERVQTTRSKVRLQVRTPSTGNRDGLAEEVTRTVTDRLDGLAQPRVDITVKEPTR
ncbi:MULTISPECIES: DUF6286 domain-containing protein [unclassified Serinicoccus]|uniref:DUF6286 domain-containing protein n=1 Tax=unclassified Serinicoccus TaxID=2643101 RepID=UPI003851C282